MSLRNQNWITFGGEPVTGMTPTQVRVFSDTPGLVMNAQQEGFVAHAYKLFCDAINISTFPNGYHVQNRLGPDGTEVRMESNLGVHRVFVKIKGGNFEELLFDVLASPRIIDHSIYGDETGSVVYLYGASPPRRFRQRKARHFGVVEGNVTATKHNAFASQPGNTVWYGQPQEIVSWWSFAPSGVFRADEDALVYAQPDGTGFIVYVDGEDVYHAMYEVLAACVWADEEGRKWLRLALNDNGSSTMRLVSTPLDDPGSTTETTTTAVTLNFLISVGRASFSADGTKLVTLQTLLGPTRTAVVEYNFGTAVGTTVLESSRHDVRSVPGTLMKCCGYDWGAFHTNSDVSTNEDIGGVIHTYRTRTTSMPAQSQSDAWNGHREIVYTQPVGAGYAGNDLVIYELEQTVRHDTSASSTFSCSGTATNYRHTYYNAALMTDVFVEQNSTGGTFTHHETLQTVDHRQVRYRVYERVAAAPRAAVYDSGWKTRFHRTFLRDVDLEYTFPEWVGTEFDEGNVWRTPTYTTNSLTETTTYASSGGDLCVGVTACRPEQRYIALAKWEWTQDDKIDGRYAQTATIIEVKDGVALPPGSRRFSTLASSGFVLGDGTSTESDDFDLHWRHFLAGTQRVMTRTTNPGANTTVSSVPEDAGISVTAAYPLPNTYFGVRCFVPTESWDTSAGFGSPTLYFDDFTMSPSVAFNPHKKARVALTSFALLACGTPLVNMGRMTGVRGILTRSGASSESVTGSTYHEGWLPLSCIDVGQSDTIGVTFPAPPTVDQRFLPDYGYTHCKVKFFLPSGIEEVDAKDVACLVSEGEVSAIESTRAWLSHPFILPRVKENKK